MRAPLRALTALILGILVLGGVFPVSRAARQAATPTAATPCPAPGEAETEDLARRFVLERLVNPAVLPQLLADNVVYHRGYATSVLTLAQAQHTAEVVHTAFPDVQVTINLLIVKDDLATVVWTAEMTNLGVLQPWDTPPNRTAWHDGRDVGRPGRLRPDRRRLEPGGLSGAAEPTGHRDRGGIGERRARGRGHAHTLNRTPPTVGQ